MFCSAIQEKHLLSKKLQIGYNGYILAHLLLFVNRVIVRKRAPYDPGALILKELFFLRSHHIAGQPAEIGMENGCIKLLCKNLLNTLAGVLSGLYDKDPVLR